MTLQMKTHTRHAGEHRLIFSATIRCEIIKSIIRLMTLNTRELLKCKEVPHKYNIGPPTKQFTQNVHYDDRWLGIHRYT